MAYNLEDGTPSFVIEVDFLKGEKGDTGFSPRIEIASLTSAEYILKIINEDGEFLTPNLKSDLSLDDYVLKEEGKGLSTNSFENEEKQKLQELHNYDDTELRSQVSGLTESIGKINSFDVKVVDELPTENIDVHTIYFVPNEQEDDNYYDEFLYVNSRWEHIGTSKVDLSNYATLQQIEELRQAQQELIDDLGKTYTGTNITAPTVAGYGRIKKLYGNTVEEGTGDKSPDNPYTLKCVGDDVNLFEETVNKPTNIQYANLILGNFSLVAGEKYTVSFDTNNNAGTVYLNENVFSNSTGVGCHGSRVKITATALETKSYTNAVLLKSLLATSIAYEIRNVKIQKGSVATSYSPYGYSTVENISKNGTNSSSNIVYVDKPLYSVGDVRDELDYTNKKITRRCGYIILDGSETWAKSGNANNVSFYCTSVNNTNFKLADIKTDTLPYFSSDIYNEVKPQIKCGSFNIISLKSLFDRGEVGICVALLTTPYEIQVRVGLGLNSTITTVEDFVASLQANPITIVYILEEETTENIECSDKIVQYADSTNIYNTDGAEIEVSLTNNETVSDINENLLNTEKRLNNINEFKQLSREDSIDFNSFTSNGFYMVNAQNCENAPDQYATGMLLVFGGYYISQLYIANLNNTTKVYARMSLDNGTTWNAWIEL